MYKIIQIFFIIVIVFSAEAQADKLTHKFKSPSFNGINTSSHYLTIENQEYSRVMTIKEELQALKDEIERDKDNKNLTEYNTTRKITYKSENGFITLTVTDPDGNTTEITLPIGSFTF